MRETIPENGERQTRPFRPLTDGKRQTAECYSTVGACVSALSLLIGPTTISRLVIAVVVDTIDGVMRRWSPTHVLKEGWVRRAPALTDLDATATVVGPRPAGARVASLQHASVDPVFCYAHSCRSVAVLSASRCDIEPLVATTRASHATAQVTRDDLLLTSACAATKNPARSPITNRPGDLGENRKKAERLSDHD
jgi:hypothetical protein